MQRVTLELDARNIRSYRTVERLGARYDGTVRDSAYFSILAGAWTQVRVGLEARLARAAPEAPAR